MSALVVLYYIIYLAIVIGVILRVGHLLHQSGGVYLDRMLSYNLKMAKSINDLLLLGYYLLNIGYSVFVLTTGLGTLNGAEDLIEFLSFKIGFVVLLLGILHFINMLVIYLLHVHHEKNFIHHKTFES